MRKRIVGVTVVTALSSLLLASSAAAAVEIGSHCLGDTYGGNATTVQIANDPADPLPAAAPSGGVITSWSVNLPPLGFALPEKLKVMRPAASATQFTTVAESALEAVLGPSSFGARIPIQAGDRLGLYGSSSTGALICSVTGKEAEVVGSAAGDTAVGSTRSFLTSEETQLPVAAKIEADVDGDGYGDETQDRCPLSAAYQADCPSLALSAKALPRRRLIQLLVATSLEAQISVFGQAQWRARRKDGRRATLIVGLRGGTTTVGAGEITAFDVPLPKAVERRLRGLTRKQSLNVKLTVSARDPIGRERTERLAVKLKGQAR